MFNLYKIKNFTLSYPQGNILHCQDHCVNLKTQMGTLFAESAWQSAAWLILQAR